jgi:hypothetical protein
MTTMLSGPEHLHVPCAGTGVCFGLDQDWFPGFWQRKAGCGPCTGANILLYLSRSGRLELPMQITDQGSFVSLMERSWEYITPGVMGLNSPFMMEIPGDTARRPDPRLAEDFIRKGLNLDSPVAFLNLSNGDIPGLESWHWVTIVGLSGTGEEAVMNIYDNGKRLDVNLRRWLKTTKRGGGFVYVDIA